ncbi:Oligopeptide-binding protein AppA [bioreactor metagenome]|uniref:Oligopeptide-binding protein AppA n=1 Tax=bioreactor metagenome TaxID=1076179 RepID=A0A644Z2J6_9ZZZZ
MLYVGFNTQKGACADSLVRQAFARGFDRQTVANVLYSGRATPAVLPISPASPYYDQILAAETNSDFSAVAMTDLLTQAGYTKSGEVMKKGRTALTLTLIVNSESSFKTATADHLAEELSKQGIQVQVSKLGWTEYEAALKAKQFDLYLGETMLAPDFDLQDLAGKTGPLNYGGYSDSQAETLLQAFRAADAGARLAAAAALCDYLQISCPFTPLCFKNTSVLTGWGIVSGLSPTQQNAFYQMWNWTLNLR